LDTEKKSIFKRIVSTRGMGQVLTVTVGFILLCIVFAIINPNFVSLRNISNLLRQIVPYLIIGIAQSYVLITGNIDLSIGSIVGMSCMMSATMMYKGVNPVLACLVTLVACLLFGLINGLLVGKYKLPPFIATLGTMTICRGIAQVVNNNHNTDAIDNTKNFLQNNVLAGFFRDVFYSGKVVTLGNEQKQAFIIYSGVILAVLIWAVFNFLLSRTRTGRHIYAVGSNVEAAKFSGVNVVATTCKVYLISALCSCVVGFITTATTGMGTMDAGNTYELYAVAASVIGGVSTLGGQGILLGTVVGAAIWAVLQNGLSLANALVGIKNIVVGVIVVLSVLLDVLIRGGASGGLKNFFGLRWFLRPGEGQKTSTPPR